MFIDHVSATGFASGYVKHSQSPEIINIYWLLTAEYMVIMNMFHKQFELLSKDVNTYFIKGHKCQSSTRNMCIILKTEK